MNLPISSASTHDILIVDDTINNVKLLSDMLSQAGFSVRKAISGSMALMAVQANKPDLVLLDINMPEMNGYEVCRRLKQSSETHEIPVVFLSASDMTADKVRAFDTGGADYITKPFHSEEVIARIQRQLLLSRLKLELKAKNQELESALTQLQKTQVELVQKQKMLGLSQLIAGMSHEFNNPLSFIVGNLKPAQQYFSDLADVLNLYRQRYPEPGAEIEAAIADLELDFITADFTNMMQSIETGTSRIHDIVQALQVFSLQGESGFKTIQLHATLDSLLVLLRSRLRDQEPRPSIQIRCNYDSNLPAVTCDAGLISQALLHLLNNAIDAIDARWAKLSASTREAMEAEPTAKPTPEIAITTSVPKPGWVAIAIQDNGIGIAEEIQARIYDPFFTTKVIGQGNGLGLSMSYQIIVNQHGGHLTFISAPAAGTTFTLQIPIEI